MSGATETEIKLAATPAMLDALRDHPLLAGVDENHLFVTTYFDSPDRRFQRAGIGLRVREKDGRREQTVKLPGRDGSIVERGEWNAPVDGKVPDLAAFPPEPRTVLDRALDGDRVARVAATRIERTTRRIAHGAATIELAFDRGEIRAERRRKAVSELELELVDGTLADLADLALALPLGPGLAWSVASKSERCYALADRTGSAAVHAGPVTLARTMQAGDGFGAIAWGCLSHLLANVSLVVDNGDNEALHQARVAMRRLRAALGLFKPLLVDDGEAAVLGAEFKGAASALGPARDSHVLLKRLMSDGRPATELIDYVRAAAERSMKDARTALAAAPFQTLLFGFARWIERGAWRDGGQARDLLPHFAAVALRKRRRTVRRMGCDLSAMTADERHHLRIAVKKLRYAADFFAALYPSNETDKALRRFGKLAAKVQDDLGDLHDLDVIAAEREALFAGIEPIGAARLSAQLDLAVPALAGGHRKLLARAGRALAKLDEAPAWWKDDL